MSEDELRDRIRIYGETLDWYDRVHLALDEGASWLALRAEDERLSTFHSYEGWLAYTESRMLNGLKDLILRVRTESNE